jgi:hypothetical protein
MPAVSRTSNAHELVRTYLKELDVALRGAPAAKARELKEQITAHLDDALPPDADRAQIGQVLRRLGSPADLAADVVRSGSWLRRWLARVSPRGWVAVVMVAALVGTAVFYLIPSKQPRPLQFGGSSLWWYAQDDDHQRETQADGATQMTVPVRPGQRQGILINIYNPSDVTQTVLGPGTGVNEFHDTMGVQPGQVRVSVPNANVGGGGETRNVRFILPAAIRPHQYRELRVIWVSNSCSQAGGGPVLDSLTLRVRIGSLIKTEIIRLGTAYATFGANHLNCR